VKIEGLHHVAVEVTDLDAALAFYVGVLGMRIRDDRPDVSAGAWLDAGDDQVHLVVSEQPPPARRRAHMAFYVDDLDSWITRLENHAVAVRQLVLTPASPRQALFTDPAGNRIEFTQR
jgi:catechol 2,3-dioxygenase-like lactoylglutathione lyase family enzyme